MEPEIVTDEDQTRKITAETLKKLEEVKKFIEANGSDHLNMIFNELIENVGQMTLKNQKQNDIKIYFIILFTCIV